MIPTNSDLRQFIIQFFSDEELETLAFDYFPEAANDFGSGMSKGRKVIALIGHCERRGRLDDRHAAVGRERAAAWNQQFTTPSVETFRRHVSTMPTARDPRQIFLSHATADAAFAYTLADDLRAEGWRVWIAPESIRPGEKWVEAIDRGLETCGVFVVALTPDAVTSRWVRTETNAAVALEHKDRIRFLPLDVTQCEPPLLWSGYQFVPFRGSYEVGLDALLRRLDDQPPANPLSDPLPEREGARIPSPPLPSTPAPPPRERHVKEEQWRQLQALAHEIATVLGKQSGDDELREVYRRFNRHFGLTTYKKLPRKRFDEGLAFFTEWRDEVVASSAETQDHLPQAEGVLVPSPGGRGLGRGDNWSQGEEDPLPNPLPQGEGAQSALPTGVTRRIHEKTGIELIRIPAGAFLYGDDRRTIDLPEFWIGRYPVTNAQYKRFVDETGYEPPSHWKGKNPPTDKLDHPVVYINWDDAQEFSEWAGLALPTEQEWEKAARGTDGRRYPWGDDWADGHCNTMEARVGGTTAVGQYSPQGDSLYGCADMAGNVWELSLIHI